LGPSTVAYVRQETLRPVVVSALHDVPGAQVVVTFSRTMDCATVTTSSVLIDDGSQAIDHVVTCSGSTASVTAPTFDLEHSPFLLAQAGWNWLRASRAGHAEGWRKVMATPFLVIPVFDFRLSRLSQDELLLPTAGGTVKNAAASLLLTVPAGVPSSTRVTLSP